MNEFEQFSIIARCLKKAIWIREGARLNSACPNVNKNKTNFTKGCDRMLDLLQIWRGYIARAVELSFKHPVRTFANFKIQRHCCFYGNFLAWSLYNVLFHTVKISAKIISREIPKSSHCGLLVGREIGRQGSSIDGRDLDFWLSKARFTKLILDENKDCFMLEFLAPLVDELFVFFRPWGIFRIKTYL